MKKEFPWTFFRKELTAEMSQIGDLFQHQLERPQKQSFSDWSIQQKLITFVYLVHLKSILNDLEMYCGSFEVVATPPPLLSSQAMQSLVGHI